MLNPVHLRTLAVVLRTGSFADAAREIGYTGSAVSQQVAALERAVQAPLVERDAQSIRPTEAAKFLASRARDIISALSTLEDDMKGFSKGDYGLMRLGSFSTASQRLIPGGLASYLRRHPNSTVELEEGSPSELAALLKESALDVAVVFHYDLVPQQWPSNVLATPLLTEELTLLLPETHRLAGADSITLQDLADENWVSGKEDTSGDACLRHLCASEGFKPRITVRSNNYDAIRGMVRSGVGIALIPALECGHRRDRGQEHLGLHGAAAHFRPSPEVRIRRVDHEPPAMPRPLSRQARSVNPARHPSDEAPRRGGAGRLPRRAPRVVNPQLG
ncbi:LysR family transcriptional regulator [Paenarthrobacter sp. NPDC089675]|uniref:LysR family transcriptional regulator n=1 Tax=Paenarthrobacter sp. NPDC089675 TaxID=3364376 RepID=UPI00382A5FFB